MIDSWAPAAVPIRKQMKPVKSAALPKEEVAVIQKYLSNEFLSSHLNIGMFQHQYQYPLKHERSMRRIYNQSRNNSNS